MAVDTIDGGQGDEKKVHPVDAHLRLWIKYLGELLKVEHSKVCTATFHKMG